MTTLTCTWKDNYDVPCGRPVPPENDHSGKAKVSFIEFGTHGMCSDHAKRLVDGLMDPEIHDLVLNSRRLDRQEARMKKAANGD